VSGALERRSRVPHVTPPSCSPRVRAGGSSAAAPPAPADAEDFLGRSISFTLVFARFWPVWAPRSLPCGLGSAGVLDCAAAAVSVPKLVILLRNSRLK
jgi:hypothetical protein